MNFSPKLRRGFTLIELLIVIVIIGILAVGLVPKVLDAPKRARDAVRKADLNSIRIALEQHAADTGAFPATSSFATALNSYFASNGLPKPPAGTTQTLTYGYYTVTGSTCSYVLFALLETKSGNFGTNATAPTTGCPATTTAQGTHFVVVGG